jgi:hypothetical protein
MRNKKVIALGAPLPKFAKALIELARANPKKISSEKEVRPNIVDKDESNIKEKQNKKGGLSGGSSIHLKVSKKVTSGWDMAYDHVLGIDCFTYKGSDGVVNNILKFAMWPDNRIEDINTNNFHVCLVQHREVYDDVFHNASVRDLRIQGIEVKEWTPQDVGIIEVYTEGAPQELSIIRENNTATVVFNRNLLEFNFMSNMNPDESNTCFWNLLLWYVNSRYTEDVETRAQ